MTSNDENEKLDAKVLESWKVASPPSGFADGVLEKLEKIGTEETESPTGLQKWLWPSLCAVFVLALLPRWFPSNGEGQNGAVVASERVTEEIGKRAIAVLESGSEVSWQGKSSAMHVNQTTGNVFYRVNRGGLFDVETPLGKVTVRGTSFRVEVRDVSKKQILGAAVAGAVLVVTVYEGKVLVGNDAGGVELLAGQRAEALAGQLPRIYDAAEDSALLKEAVALHGDEGDPRREIEEIKKKHKKELDDLRNALREAMTLGHRSGHSEGEGPWAEPSQETLLELAENCAVRVDIPPILKSSRYRFPEERGEDLGLTQLEQDAVHRALDEMQDRFREQLRELYLETTADLSGADLLSPDSLRKEIIDKAPEGELREVRARISQERAGLREAPRSTKGMSPTERYFRIYAALGKQLEERYAEILGKERAHSFRGEGWGMSFQSGGCPE